MEDFVDRQQELHAFETALDELFEEDKLPRILFFHGTSGMGKTSLIQKCQQIALQDPRQPFTIVVDCDRTIMLLDVILNEIEKTLQVNQEKAGSRMFWFTNQSLINPERPEAIFEQIFSIAQADELNQLYSLLEY